MHVMCKRTGETELASGETQVQYELILQGDLHPRRVWHAFLYTNAAHSSAGFTGNASWTGLGGCPDIGAPPEAKDIFRAAFSVTFVRETPSMISMAGAARGRGMRRRKKSGR
jgi:hypothetical protein